MKFKSLFFIVLISGFFISGDCFAFLSGRNAGTTSAQFLKLGIGAKSAGMGNASLNTVYNADAIYWNPANLNHLYKKELSFSHAVWFEDISYEWLSFVLPTKKYGTFGAGLQYLSYGEIGRIDNQGISSSSFSPVDMAMYLSYANAINDIKVGGNIKFIYSKIENSASAAAVDIGASYNLPDNKTSIGAVLYNFGTEMKFNYESAPLPLLFKLGASHWVVNNLQLALDLNFPNDNDLYFNFGGEYTVSAGDNTNVFLRAGYDGRKKDVSGFNWINLGFGIGYSDYMFDYAFSPYGDIGMTHRISFGIKFGEYTEKL